ncbi:MAG: glycosyltransferase [Candidatus Shapirobacteria bacterium]
MKTYLSVVIPCYNEEANLKRGVLDQVNDYLKKQNYSWEVLISDDGSTDQSLKICSLFAKKHKGFRILKNKHGGKPWAVSQGVKEAQGEYILFTDIDQSTPINQLDKLLPWAKKNYPIVIGSRGLERKDFPLFRRVGAIIFALIRRFLLLRDIKDTQCGFKLFQTSLVKEIFPYLDVLRQRAKGWVVSSYDVELLYMASVKGAKIKEVVVTWEDEDISTSKGNNYLARYFKEAKKMFFQILQVKRNQWQGKYLNI